MQGEGGDTSPDAWDRLNKAKERLQIYKKEMDEAKKQAMEDFKEDDNPDKPQFFAQWAPLNANAYLVAVQNWYVKSYFVYNPTKLWMSLMELGKPARTRQTM